MDERTLMGMHGGSQALQRHLCDPTSPPLSINPSTAGGLRETQRGEFKRRLWINIKCCSTWEKA